jgi:protein-disulfide isomerase
MAIHNKWNKEWDIYLLGVIAVLMLFSMAFVWHISSSVDVISEKVDNIKVAAPAQQQQAGQQQQAQQKVDVKVGNAPVKGSKSAKVDIVVFSDPSCPFCGGAAGMNKEVVDYLKSRSPSWTPSVPNIIKDYVDTGKARISFKYFPGHGKGIEAMEMMWCANEQGKFWEMHDVMFANQNLMEKGDVAGLKAAAETVSGLDKTAFETCIAGDKYAAQYDADTQEGSQYGVQGTPAFFINGNLVEGAVPYSQIKTVIDKELNA